MKLWQKYATTAVVYYCSMSIGISKTSIAPLLIDFTNGLSTTTETLSWVMTAGHLVALISDLIFGVLFNHVNRHLCVATLVFLAGLTTFFLPYTKSLAVFGILHALQDVCGAGYLIAQVVWIMEIWQLQAGPFIQAQYFFFALGCIFPPLIYAPFLNRNSTVEDSLILSNAQESPLDLRSNGALFLTNDTTEDGDPLVNLRKPCAVCAGIIAAGTLLLLLSYWIERRAERTQKEDSEVSPSKQIGHDSLGKGGNPPQTDLDKSELISTGEVGGNRLTLKKLLPRKVILLILCAVLISGVESMENVTLSFLPVFSHYSSLQLTEHESADLLSAYTIAYTAARAVGIILIFKIPARFILIANLFLIVAANIVILLSPTETWMYVGVILLGIGFSTSIPSVFVYAQLHLDMTNLVVSILALASGTLAMVFVLVVGSFVEEAPSIFAYLNLGCVTACACSLVTIMFFMKGHKTRPTE